jgi:hypothetical protein
MTHAETNLIRRFTAEPAWLLILAREADIEVQELNSRTVDSYMFEREREQWTNWHQQQTGAARIRRVKSCSVERSTFRVPESHTASVESAFPWRTVHLPTERTSSISIKVRSSCA